MEIGCNIKENSESKNMVFAFGFAIKAKIIGNRRKFDYIFIGNNNEIFILIFILILIFTE